MRKQRKKKKEEEPTIEVHQSDFPPLTAFPSFCWLLAAGAARWRVAPLVMQASATWFALHEGSIPSDIPISRDDLNPRTRSGR